MLVGVESKGAWILVMSSVLVALGCGSSDHPPPTLSPSDVTNLPAGNAVGTTFSGVYVLSNATIADCNCRVGSCAMWHGDKGDVFTLTETDGALHIDLSFNGSDELYDGSVDRNGAFRAGGSIVTASSKAYSLLSGTVKAGVSIDAESQNTFTGQLDGNDVDCDIVGKLQLTYEPQ
jgi:hypothetical protein